VRAASISNESTERPAAERFIPAGVTFGATSDADFAAAFFGRAAISSKRVTDHVDAA